MIFQKDGLYHIYNRGCNKENIFFCDENYHYLIRKMEQHYNDNEFRMLAFCLMPNHYHFFMKQVNDNPISSWIQYIFNGYVQAVNNQQNRSGTLFESSAKYRIITNERYLINICHYIHNNPVVAGIVDSPEEWSFSNYLECIGKRNGVLVDRNFIYDNFNSYSNYAESMKEYQKSNEKNNKEMIELLYGSDWSD